MPDDAKWGRVTFGIISISSRTPTPFLIDFDIWRLLPVSADNDITTTGQSISIPVNEGPNNRRIFLGRGASDELLIGDSSAGLDPMPLTLYRENIYDISPADFEYVLVGSENAIVTSNNIAVDTGITGWDAYTKIALHFGESVDGGSQGASREFETRYLLELPVSTAGQSVVTDPNHFMRVGGDAGGGGFIYLGRTADNSLLYTSNNGADTLPLSVHGVTISGLAGGGGGGGAGPQGVPGQDGAQGPQGIQGQPGQDGSDGEDGADGATGLRGERGNPGPQGIQGIDGSAGQPGQDGEDGATGPQGIPGQDGTGGGGSSDITNEVYAVIVGTETGPYNIAKSPDASNPIAFPLIPEIPALAGGSGFYSQTDNERRLKFKLTFNQIGSDSTAGATFKVIALDRRGASIPTSQIYTNAGRPSNDLTVFDENEIEIRDLTADQITSANQLHTAFTAKIEYTNNDSVLSFDIALTEVEFIIVGSDVEDTSDAVVDIGKVGRQSFNETVNTIKGRIDDAEREREDIASHLPSNPGALTEFVDHFNFTHGPGLDANQTTEGRRLRVSTNKLVRTLMNQNTGGDGIEALATSNVNSYNNQVLTSVAFGSQGSLI